MYQHPYLNREFNFFIPIEAYNGHENVKDYQHPNHNSGIAHSYLVTTQAIRFIKQSTQVVKYNRNFNQNNYDEDIEFIDVIDLLYNQFYF